MIPATAAPAPCSRRIRCRAGRRTRDGGRGTGRDLSLRTLQGPLRLRALHRREDQRV